MRPLPPCTVPKRAWVGQQPCRKAFIARCLTSRPQGRAANQEANVTFEALGIRRVVATSLRAAFPDVKYPTSMQTKLITAMLGKKDVLLQDCTGSGKSFAVMLALLSKSRVFLQDREDGEKGGRKRGITTLLIVPHRDLAYQYLHWIHRIVLVKGNMTSSTVSSIAKVLVRGSPPESMHQEFPHLTGSIISPASDLSALHRDPPHILIGTPNAIMDVIHRVPGCLHLRALSTVVVDEIDSLLRWAPSHVRGPRKKKVLRKIEKHPMTLLQIMDALFASETANRPWSHRKAFLSDQHAPAQRPQLVFLSATLRNRLRTALYGAFGWLKRDHVAQLIWAPSKSHPAHALNRTVDHHVLVVSEDGSIKNLPGARSCKEVEHHQSIEANTTTESGDEFLYEEEDAMLDEADADSMDLPLTVNPVMLEAVASIFALDVPRVALLILPASASVRRVIFELRQLGVDAHALDLLGNEAGGAHLLSRDASVPSENPTLLVSTQATTRGIDFPALSHVFLLGVPRERAGDAYLHFGGRVGRFGKRGKVVTILEAKRLMDEKLAVGDEPKKMSILLKQMGITPTKLEHFD